MKSINKLRDRRAVSPVIATVILVAVAITVAVAVAYWMGGIAGQYTKFEKVEIQTAVCTWDDSGAIHHWKIEMKVKNTGTAASTLISAFINEVEVQNYDPADVPTTLETSTNMTEITSIESGDNVVINFYIALGYKTLSSGTTINIKIHSAGGMDYIKLVELI